MCFYGGHSTGYKLGNHPKNIEPCAHRARTVRAPSAHRATTPPMGCLGGRILGWCTGVGPLMVCRGVDAPGARCTYAL